MEPTHSIRAALCGRIAAYIETVTPSAFWRGTVVLFTAWFLSAAVVNADWTFGRIEALLGWHEFALPKVAMVWALVLGRHRLRSLYGHLKGMAKASAPKVPTIETMPVEGVIEHLVTEGTFKRHEVMEKFRPVAQYRVERLTKKLKEIGVLATGENGMSVFDPSYTRQDLAELFCGKKEAAELSPLFRRDGGGLTSMPTPLSPTPPLSNPFAVKTLAAASHATGSAADAQRTVPGLRRAHATLCAA